MRIALALGFLLLIGCGDGRPTRVPVAGKVLIDGQPLTKGFVRVVPANDRAATGAIDEEGRFRLTTFEQGDGCVPGTHPVEIIALESISDTETLWLVPKKYHQAATSGLTVTIDGPTDDLTIELTWNGGRPYIERSGP